MKPRVGVLHPGEMGSFVAAAIRRTMGEVFWCAADRSAATTARAREAGLSALPDLRALCEHCDLIIGICPPHAALDQARALIAQQFAGTYVEANAIAPASVGRIAGELADAGITCVDAGIVGLPRPAPDSAWLYLSGPDAERVADCFAAGPMPVRILGEEIGAASALKLCYAAWNKGSTALLAAVQAAASSHEVYDALAERWDHDQPGSAAAGANRVRRVARKAWRFGGEMDEIARFLNASNVPSGFFAAAATLYRRQSHFKDCDEPPSLEQILEAVLAQDPEADQT